MNLVKTFIVLMIGLTTICCKNQTSKTTKFENENRENSIHIEDKYLITERGVLGLFIGDIMPETLENFKLTKSIKIVEEGNEEPIINITDDNAEILQIGFEYEETKGNYSNKIREILIKNKRFRTDKNIGIESTINDFISSYSNYDIWYSYISGSYVIQSKDMKIQFLLDENKYIGKKDLMESDMIELSKEDFSSNTKIVEIRIY